MTLLLSSLAEVIDEFDVAVLDQWGVLHNGSMPYPEAEATLRMLIAAGKQIVVVSNSGKRADVNAERIAQVGLPIATDTTVVTSGEVLWQDLSSGRLVFNGRSPDTFFPICAEFADAVRWADGLVTLTTEIDESVDAILVMGLAEETSSDACDHILRLALGRDLPLICSNPDKSSPRADGLVTSPGAVAERYSRMGGTVLWYGKPHRRIYEAVLGAYPDVERDRFLMVGDSLEHDIAGAYSVGFRSVLVRGGIHSQCFADATDISEMLQQLASRYECELPHYSVEFFC